MVEAFSDRLSAAMERAGSPACVGLDPVLEKIPEAVRRAAADPVRQVLEFCLGVIEAVRPFVAVVKPQSACFERFGAPGVAALKEVIGAARGTGMLVVLDAKRGDIGVTGEHYAAAAFDQLGADAVTVSGYLGPETLEPFLRAGRGVFVLVRTSNPGSDAVQSQRLADGRTVAEMMAGIVARSGAGRRGVRGLSDVGAVVAATKPADGASLRRLMPDQVFLVPGFGAQGGTLEDCRTLVRPGSGGPADGGVLVTASRSVIYAGGSAGEGWAEAVGRAAVGLRGELGGLWR